MLIVDPLHRQLFRPRLHHRICFTQPESQKRSIIKSKNPPNLSWLFIGRALANTWIFWPESQALVRLSKQCQSVQNIALISPTSILLSFWHAPWSRTPTFSPLSTHIALTADSSEIEDYFGGCGYSGVPRERQCMHEFNIFWYRCMLLFRCIHWVLSRERQCLCNICTKFQKKLTFISQDCSSSATQIMFEV